MTGIESKHNQMNRKKQKQPAVSYHALFKERIQCALQIYIFQKSNFQQDTSNFMKVFWNVTDHVNANNAT